MVNINQLNELTQSLNPSTKTDNGKGDADAFQNALNKAMDTPGDTSESAAASGLGEISATRPILNDPSAAISGQTEKLLDLLDSYAGQLESSQVTLKQIAPMIQEINDAAGQLQQESQGLGSDHEELKNIADQTVMTARSEYIRFQRGDYLS